GCRPDVAAREKRQLHHARTLFRQVRASTRVAHDADLAQVAPQVPYAPRLVPLDEIQRLVQSGENVGRRDVRPRVVDNDREPAHVMQDTEASPEPVPKW